MAADRRGEHRHATEAGGCGQHSESARQESGSEDERSKQEEVKSEEDDDHVDSRSLHAMKQQRNRLDVVQRDGCRRGQQFERAI